MPDTVNSVRAGAVALSPRWEPDFPADLRAIVEPHLMRWLPLLPTWCQEFRVRYRGDGDGATAKVAMSHKNRWAVLTVHGAWIDEPEEEREEAVIHELIHVALEPFSAASGRILEDLTEKDTPLRSLADSMFTDGLECTVDDLARSIQRLMAWREASANGVRPEPVGAWL